MAQKLQNMYYETMKENVNEGGYKRERIFKSNWVFVNNLEQKIWRIGQYITESRAKYLTYLVNINIKTFQNCIGHLL